MTRSPNPRRPVRRTGSHRRLRPRLRRPARREANPLRRPADLARVRLTAALWVAFVLAVLIGAVTAAAVYGAGQRAAADEAGHRHRTTATTLQPAPDADGWASMAVRPAVPVRWSSPAGPGTGTVPVDAGTAKGATVAVWLDDSGRVVDAPVTAVELTARAVIDGLAALTTTAALASAVCLTLRRRLDRRTEDAWEREWERIEPGWSGRSHSA